MLGGYRARPPLRDILHKKDARTILSQMARTKDTMSETAQEYRFKAHSQKQEALIFSDTQETVGATGTQWGKSVSAALWLKRQIHQFKSKEDNFLLMAPTYKVMNQSMLPYFLSRMSGLGVHKSSLSQFDLYTGGTVYFRTGTDPNSVVGIPRVRAYWLDEAGLATLYFWENIQARAAAIGAKGLLTTSPYSRNWLYKQFIKPYIKKGQDYFRNDSLTLLAAPSWENPYHTLHDPHKRSEMRAKMDHRRFDMIFGGEWGQMTGLVYDCFDEDQNVIDNHPSLFPAGTKFYGGIDWGYTEPFVLTVRAITPAGMHYQVSEFYQSGMTIPQILLLARQKMNTWGIERFYCGQDRPENVEVFCQNGLPCQSVDNDNRKGIDLHYELIKTRQYQIIRGTSPHTMDELDTYHYPEPKEVGPDDKAVDQLPVQQNDHCVDSCRYITIATYRSRLNDPKLKTTSSDRVVIMPENQQKRLRKLMQPSHRRSRHTESWKE